VFLTVATVVGESESEHGEEALAITTTTSLTLKIADHDVEPPTAGKTNKRFSDDDIFDVFAQSDDEAATAAVRRRKRPRRGDVLHDIVNDDKPTCEARHRLVKRRTRPSQSVRQTRGAHRPAFRGNAKLVTHSVRRGESLAGAGWQVKEILGERQTNTRFTYKVTTGEG
jgi:hypothetical protein